MRLMNYAETYQANLNFFPNVLYAFMFSLTVYLASHRNLDVSTDFLEEKRNFGITDEFDFIVVGAGSAGALVANRLSKNYSVLLMDSGGEPHPLHLIPMFSLFLLNYPQIDWQHKTVPQKNSTFAQNHRESLLSQGKALGGTSNINFMMHSRGNPKDFDTWAEMLGTTEWSYDKLLPYFKKYENYIRDPLFRYNENDSDNVHGSDGELTIQVPPFTGLAEKYLQAAEELGYPRVDLNGRYTEGEVLFGKDNEAYGVRYDHHRKPRYAYARREVILSAGALNSPKILLLSGIGPKQDLEELGIPVMQDLPQVGRNLQDHACTYLGPFFLNDSVSFSVDRDLNAVKFTEFLGKGSGPMTSPQTSAFGFFSSNLAKATGEQDWPDLQLIFVGASICQECDRFIAQGFNMNEETLKKYYKNAKGRDSFLQIVSNGRPKARGDVKLRSSNPYTPALIDPKYLDNVHDLAVTVEGVKKAVELVENTTVFQKYGGEFTTEPFPGCENLEFRSDAYWECYIKQYTVSLHHMVGTCSIGKSAQTGVVDPELRVFGTKRLRVIDASVMPMVPVGNTNAPTIMIGEKGADLILKLWENK